MHKHCLHAVGAQGLKVFTLSALMLASIASAHTDHDEHAALSLGSAKQVHEFDIRLQGAVNSMYEYCKTIKTGGLVTVRFQTEYPIEFDVHHHTANDTLFPIKVSNVKTFSDQFVAQDELEYCFNFVNKTLRNHEWSISVHLGVIPLVRASQ